MTANPKIQKRRIPGKISAGDGLFAFFLAFLLCLFFKNGVYAANALRESLTICARSVIPSLFPFMVLSGMILASPLLIRAIAFLATPLQKWMKISPTGAAAVCVGMICGFPAGAVFATNAVKSGRMPREEIPRVLAAASNPSPAFFLGIVGKELFHDTKKGLLLYGIVLAVQILVGGLFARMRKQEKNLACSCIEHDSRTAGKIASFTEAVGSSARGMLMVCAYVVFFSACAGAFREFLDGIGCPAAARAGLFCLTELTGGCFAAAGLPSPALSSALIAFAAGWSGLSVHFQLLTLTDGTTDSYGTYWRAKSVQGILCAVVGSMLLK